jgi:hypothetical protein
VPSRIESLGGRPCASPLSFPGDLLAALPGARSKGDAAPHWLFLYGGAKFERICRCCAFLMGVQSSRSNVPQDRPLALARAYYGEGRTVEQMRGAPPSPSPTPHFLGGFRTAGPLPRDNRRVHPGVRLHVLLLFYWGCKIPPQTPGLLPPQCSQMWTPRCAPSSLFMGVQNRPAMGFLHHILWRNCRSPSGGL